MVSLLPCCTKLTHQTLLLYVIPCGLWLVGIDFRLLLGTLYILFYLNPQNPIRHVLLIVVAIK